MNDRSEKSLNRWMTATGPVRMVAMAFAAFALACFIMSLVQMEKVDFFYSLTVGIVYSFILAVSAVGLVLALHSSRLARWWVCSWFIPALCAGAFGIWLQNSQALSLSTLDWPLRMMRLLIYLWLGMSALVVVYGWVVYLRKSLSASV